MAYRGGYADQRPYNGPMHHDQRGYGGGGGGGPPQHPQNYGAPQHYDNYNDGYGYDDYHNADHRAYGQGYADQYPDPSQDRRQPQPQQDHRGPDPRMGGQPPHAGRGGGGYPQRGGIAPGPAREHRPEPAHNNGRPPVHGHNSDPSPAGHRNPSHGGDPRPRNQDQQMAEQMGRMRLNGYDPRLAPKPKAGAESQKSPETQQPPASAGRGRPPPQRVYSQHSDEPRRGPPPQDQAGYNAYNNGYSRDPSMHSNNEFGPPVRAQTMPAQSQYMDPPPQRHHPVPHEDPARRGMPPRPPPQRQHTSNPYPDHYDQQWDSHHNGGHAGAQYDYEEQPRRSFTQPYGSEYNDPRGATQGYEPYDDTKRSSLPDFDNIPRNGRGSFEETMRPGPNFDQPQPGAHQTAQLSHAKSQPDLRQPQSAVFEMPADVPSVPPLPQFNNNMPSQRALSYGGGDGNMPHQDPVQMPARGPSAPPGATTLPRPSQSGRITAIPPVPPASAPQLVSDPDALPSHPTPVRAGLMSGSVVNLNAKPPPVRNYGGVPHTGTPQPQVVPQAQAQQPPPIQIKAQPPKQPQAPVTPQELEHLRMVIKNNPNDTESALRLAKRLIEAVDVLVPRIPDPRARGRGRERYLMDAHKILKKQCHAQVPEAMFILADSLGRGLFGGEGDTKEAFTLYQSAAKLGHAGAAYRTAVCCEIGQDEGGGTRKDPLKAIQWYKRAAALGDTPAMYKVGMISLKGLLGQPRNPREAIGWLKRAAERADPENPHALHELGLLYESAQPNDAIVRDEKYAYSLFLQAAELGYKFSQFRLGCAFEYGSLGCPVDPRQSIMWYSRAAQREEHQAELALSGWYLTGSEGVIAQSDVEAYLWARKAAVAGLAKAEYAMGYFTEVGIGTAANLEDAKRWYWRAAAQDFPKARDRLEELKRAGRNAPRQRERISRSKIERQPEGECSVM